MANEFTDSFKKLIRGEKFNEKLLVPMLIWASGHEPNIEGCQRINRKIFGGYRKLYISELVLINMLNKFIAYPREFKDDTKTKFFYKDVAKYFRWTLNELEKNTSVINYTFLKPIIAREFGYDKTERELIGL